MLYTSERQRQKEMRKREHTRCREWGGSIREQAFCRATCVSTIAKSSPSGFGYRNTN